MAVSADLELPRPSSVARQFYSLLLGVRSIMIQESDVRWIRGIEGCLARLPEHPGDLSETEVRDLLCEASRCYRGLVQPKEGGFSDFFIWRETVEERISANQKLKELRHSIWEIVEEFGFDWADH